MKNIGKWLGIAKFSLYVFDSIRHSYIESKFEESIEVLNEDLVSVMRSFLFHIVTVLIITLVFPLVFSKDIVVVFISCYLIFSLGHFIYIFYEYSYLIRALVEDSFSLGALIKGEIKKEAGNFHILVPREMEEKYVNIIRIMLLKFIIYCILYILVFRFSIMPYLIENVTGEGIFIFTWNAICFPFEFIYNFIF